MKTISLFFLAFTLIILGCSKSDDFPVDSNDDALLKSAENGAGYTEQYYSYPLGPGEYWLPVICDGVEVDFLVGDGAGVVFHVLTHYKNGEMKWGKSIVKGKLTSGTTGETFTIHEVNKFTAGDPYFTSHTNAIGDQGTHYIFSAKYVFPTSPGEEGTYEDLKAMCVPNSKNK